MILKTNLHFHAIEDDVGVRYSIYNAIDCAKEKNFDVLAYTPHKKFLFHKKYAEYAGNKGILLIPGTEMKIKRKEIVILNCDKEIEKVKTFQELADYKKRNPQILIMAPHPFVFGLKNLGRRLLKNIALFDAVEMSVYSNKILNFNKKAGKTAAKYNKPFIATSDTHFFKDFERGYALIETRNKSIEAIFGAIKNGNFQNKSNSMSLLSMLAFYVKIIFNILS